MERVELHEPRQEGSAWDGVCPPPVTLPDLGWVSLPMADKYLYFSLSSKVTGTFLYEDEECDSTYVFTMAHRGNSLQVRGFRLPSAWIMLQGCHNG